MTTHWIIVTGSLLWLTGVLAIKATLAIRDERRQKRSEYEAGRRILQAQQWRVSNLIDQRVRAARENQKRSGGDR